ncbi:MAG: sterol desaturase family protein [Proteobacteria bacterium]|nr:sterol desaturase family protein [Pseudomonadota bacterium]
MGTLAKLYMILLPVVLGAAVVEGLWLSRTRREGYDWKAWGTSVADLAVRRLLFLVPFSLATPVFAWAYEHRLFTFHIDNVGSVLLLFISLEFFYYWYHRASHTVRWFWNSHSVHHSPNRFNLAAAYRLGWLGKFTGATIFFTPLSLLGFEPYTVLAALFLNLLYQFWIHADWIPKLGWLEYVLNTPSAHRVHHARNPEYLDANYGGVLIVFDRLFGTYIEERKDLPCEYGLVTRVTTYNPVLINLQPWIGLAKDLLGARSLGEVWGYLFGAPGWRPDGQGLTTAELRARAVEAKAAALGVS